MGRNNKTVGFNNFKVEAGGCVGCMSRIRMGGTQWPHTLMLGGKERKEGREEKVKIKRTVLPDDSFVARQTSYSRATYHLCGPSFATECCHSGGGETSTNRGLVPETHWNVCHSPVAERVLPFDTCSHVCSCKQHVCPQFI